MRKIDEFEKEINEFARSKIGDRARLLKFAKQARAGIIARARSKNISVESVLAEMKSGLQEAILDPNNHVVNLPKEIPVVH